MQPVFLIARPRSGTTAFRSVFEVHPEVGVLGEVFHDRFLEHPKYFFNYYLRSVENNPEKALPGMAERAALLEGYVKHAQSAFAPNHHTLLMSVNYNSLHVLNYYWQNFHEAPLLVTLICHQGYKVIHLVRRNIVAAAISELRARRTGVWHLEAGQAPPPEARLKLSVNPSAFLLELRARRLEIELLESALSGYPLLLPLEYEVLFRPDGRLDESQLEKVRSFLGLKSPISQIPRHVRTREDKLMDAIENYEELREALAPTEFSGALD